MKDLLRQKIADALAASPPPLTRRNVRLQGGRGKAVAVIGMRRSGKTTFLWQCIQDCLDLSAPPTREREERALAAAAAEFPEATPLLITVDSMPPQPPLLSPLRWRPAAAWVLDSPAG